MSTGRCDECGVVVTDQTPSAFYVRHDETCSGELDEPSRSYPGWVVGDPCRACGSHNTGWSASEGTFCHSCGRSDSDE